MSIGLTGTCGGKKVGMDIPDCAPTGNDLLRSMGLRRVKTSVLDGKLVQLLSHMQLDLFHKAEKSPKRIPHGKLSPEAEKYSPP